MMTALNKHGIPVEYLAQESAEHVSNYEENCFEF
jgi:hypothetical protein